MAAAVLDREMYTEAEAARLLRLPQSTLHYWLEGGRQRGRLYQPILRMEPTDRRVVTWAEFVEAALLRQYRRTHLVPMAELRAFICLLRERFNVPYPLADRRPYVLNKELVHEAQREVGLAADFYLVHEISGQMVLTAPSERFLERVEWEGDVAAGWRPAGAEELSPVKIRPEMRFGRPAVRGISTAAVWEQHDSGEDVAELAEVYHLTVPEVRYALAYENDQRAAAAA